MARVSIEYKYFWAPSIVFRDRNKDVQPRTADWRYETVMSCRHYRSLGYVYMSGDAGHFQRWIWE